jgi:hypothetical protein
MSKEEGKAEWKEVEEMVPAIGEKLRNSLTGKMYNVKLVGDRMVVLESEDRLTQVLSTAGNLRLFYEKVEIKSRTTDLPGFPQPGGMLSLDKNGL